jgi:hypothetical protein
MKSFSKPETVVLKQHFERKLVELEEEKKMLQVTLSACHQCCFDLTFCHRHDLWFRTSVQDGYYLPRSIRGSGLLVQYHVFTFILLLLLKVYVLCVEGEGHTGDRVGILGNHFR